MIVITALIVAVIVTIALTFGTLARSDSWRATVTPLASIIGPGFLICGPLLARAFGSAALGTMALAYAVSVAYYLKRLADRSAALPDRAAARTTDHHRELRFS